MLPSYLTPFVVLSALSALAALTLLVRSPSVAEGPGRSAGTYVSLGLAVWLVLAFAAGNAGLYVARESAVPTIEVGIMVPIVVAIGAYLALPGLRQLVRRVPQEWLVGVQLYRAGGAIFLILWGMGLIPGAFAGPSGIGDVLVGLAAPVVALLYVRYRRRARAAVLWWNIAGLLDLVSALTLGFLTAPSRFQLLALDAPNTLVTQFPLVLIPTFIVPLSILLHLASLARLRAEG